jgi:hypothetical protein
MSAAVQVLVRLKPVPAGERSELLSLDEKEAVLEIRNPRRAAPPPAGMAVPSVTIDNTADTFRFGVNGVLSSVSQEAVFGAAVRDLADGTLSGISTALLAYGQVGRTVWGRGGGRGRVANASRARNCTRPLPPPPPAGRRARGRRTP